jgi:hypothetical protein
MRFGVAGQSLLVIQPSGLNDPDHMAAFADTVPISSLAWTAA